MEFAHACKGLGVRPIVGAELTRRGRLPHHAAGRVDGGLAQPLPADHRGARGDPHPAGTGEGHPGCATRSRPRCRLRSSRRHAEGLVCLSGCARDGAVAGRWERGDRARRRRRWRGGCSAAFGPERFRVELQRPLWRRDRARNRWLASLAERARRPLRRHRQRPRPRPLAAGAPGRAGRGPPGRDPRRDRGAAAGQLGRGPALARPRRRARFRDHPEAVAESGPPRRAAALRPHPRPRLQLPRRRGPRPPTGGWPSSAGRGWASAIARRLGADRAERARRRGWTRSWG